jgi:urease accessory protein
MKSQLHITAGCRNDKTYLKNSFCTHPFKIGNVTEDKTKSVLKLMMMSSSPGVLDRDEYNIEIEVEENALLQINTQGYQRIFTMQDAAKQITNVRLHNNASLWYLPHPAVPHKHSNYKAVNNIHLKTNHTFCWSEIITCGRKLCNEEFTFTRFQNTTNVYINDKLVVKENLLLQPHITNVSLLGQMEGYTHQSTLLYLDNRVDCEYLMLECREMLLSINGIEFGISQLPVNGFTVRILGYKGEQLFDIQKQLASLLSEEPSTIPA